MRKHIRWLWIVGFFGSLAAANAQTPAPAAASIAFDGTYAFVSGTRLNESYTTKGTEHIKRCGGYKGGPLTIVNAHASYGSGRGFDGTVAPQGELTMRLAPTPVNRGISPGVEVTINGRIDADGTVRARRVGYYCSYELVWRKIPK